MDLEEEILTELGSQISQDIDFEIISNLLMEIGWTRISFSPVHDGEQCFAIKQWLDDNCKGRVNSRGSVWLFEQESDAVNFSLRWS